MSAATTQPNLQQLPSVAQHTIIADTLETSDHSYYPSAHRMESNNSNITVGLLKKPRMELVIYHDQPMETSVVDIQQQQQIQPESPPTIRCTICKDSDGNTLFYRPSIALNTLFQVPKQSHPSSTTTTNQEDHAPRRSIDTTATYIQDNDNKDILKQQNDSDNRNHDDDDDNDDDDDDDTNTISNNIDERTSRKDSQMTDDTYDPLDESLQRLVIPKQRQSYVTLYDATNDQPLWSLIEQDWHTMTLLSRQFPHQYMLMTTSTFSFVWEGITDDKKQQQQQQQQQPPFLFPYQWQMKMANDGKSMDLLCEQCQSDQTKKPIALLTKQATQLILFGDGGGGVSLEKSSTNNKNPFRSAQRKMDNLDTFLVLSGLLLFDLISSQLKSLGGGMEAITMMIERQQEALKEEMVVFHKQYQYYRQQQQRQSTGAIMMIMDDDALRMNPTRYYMNQSGNEFDDNDNDDNGDMLSMGRDDHLNDDGTRWSSASMKSLELDPGLWRCWWGYGCWWNWFPCCMPGGWCDRAWIKARGGARMKQKQQQQHHHHHHRSRVTRRMQGWQQQQEE